MLRGTLKATGALLFLVMTLSGCSTLVEKSAHVLEGSAFKEKVLGVYREQPKQGIRVSLMREKGGEEFLAITSDAVPNLRIRGTLPNLSEIMNLSTGGSFQLDSLYFLSPNLTGWNEFTLGLSGGGIFTVTGTGATLHLDMPVIKVSVTAGKIRRDNNRISGDQAFTALRNRQERISALTEWMHTENAQGEFKDQDAFDKYWKPILLPELVSHRKRPPDWSKENAVWVIADDVKWNTAYTRARFPEELHKVRDSGTLLRDWEEALSWIYFDYEWDALIASLNKDITLIKVK
ncbi:hypothetical protein AGMMS49587_04330 [Spirochaetia bacterium]|nr:hypothetical protein AGMMS49587_04330 [Spirochaetia bacterium]